MKSLLSLFAVLILAVSALGQTLPSAPEPQLVTQTWAFTTSVVALPGNHQTIAATDSGILFTPSPNLDLFDRNLIGSDGVLKFFGAGGNYRIAWLNKKLDNLSQNVNFLRVQIGVSASAGIDQISLGGTTKNHFAFTGGPFVNYMLNKSGSWTLGGKFEYAKLVGYQNNGWIAQINPAFHF